MAAASEPASGSVVPSVSIGSAKKPFEVMRLPMPAQPWHNSSCTRQPVSASVSPPPPSSSGSMNAVRPMPAALCHRSHGVSVSASSTAAAAGRISRAAKSRQTRRISSCSGVSSNTRVTVPLPDGLVRKCFNAVACGRMSPSLTGGELVARSLAQHGVELVFGIPGTHNLPLYAHLEAHGLRHVSPRHEQGGGYAADAYARVSGRPGVVITTAGPAVMNVATAAAQAHSDSSPLLVVAPGMPRAHPAARSGHLHEMPDQAGAMRGATGHSVRVMSHAELASELAAAFIAFRTERPGARFVEVLGDAGDALALIGEALDGVPPDGGAARAAVLRARLDAERAERGARYAPWLAALRDALPDGAVIAADNAMAAYHGAIGGLPVTRPRSLLFPTGFGTLGFAVPAAIGAALGAPDRPVAALSGDGGLMFTVAELAMAAELGLSLPVVVFVNEGYGEIRNQMLEAGQPPVGVDLPVPDLPGVARALGCEGVPVADPDGLRAAVAAALTAPVP